ncbi:MAG: hypothetical protein IT281_08485 [Ignavibacteria bacterium]|nr:hypothetical protein [Ignavibacteria bacterium]
MTSKEIKLKIIDAVNNVPDTELVDVLNYLEQIKNYNKQDLQNISLISKILKEDDQILRKLAE